jgi:hypothetical protein
MGSQVPCPGSQMQRRRTGPIVITAVVVLVAVVGSAATGRLSLLARAWEPVASSVPISAWFTLAPTPETSSAPGDADAGAPGADAAAIARRQTAPLSSAQLGAPLVHGTFVSACGAPDDMKVVVNVTVKMGHAVQVTATTQPSNPAVASCIERRTRELSWDISPKTDHVTVTY